MATRGPFFVGTGNIQNIASKALRIDSKGFSFLFGGLVGSS